MQFTKQKQQINQFHLQQQTKRLIKMDSNEIIKRRLAELKKMSIELKQSTQNSESVNYNLVNDILEATKSSASKLEQIRKLGNRNHRKIDMQDKKIYVNNNQAAMPYKALFPQTTNEHFNDLHSHSQSYSSQRRINPTNQYSKKHHTLPFSYQQNGYSHNQFINNQQNHFLPPQQQFIGQLFTPNYSNSPNAYNNDEQVHYLREQNSNLERTIVTMRHQILQLRQKVQKATKQQQWKSGLPYFHLNQQISAFYTRLRINEQDYQKIDYLNYNAQLTLQKLIVKKSSGTAHPKELHMTDLKEVHYIDSIVMLLHFGYENQSSKNQQKDNYSHDDFEQNLFIRFNNQEELHRWDLALYINFNLVSSLKKDKLFSTYIKQSRSRSKSRKKSLQSRPYRDSQKKSKRESEIIQDDSDLMKKLIERRDLYLQTKKLVSQRMIQKVNEKKNLQSSGNKKISKDQNSQEYSQTHPLEFQNQEEYKNQKSKFNYKHQKQDVQKNIRKNDSSHQKDQRSNTSGFKDFTNPTLSNGNYNLKNVENVFIPPLNLASKKNQRQLSFSPQNHELSLSQKLVEQEKNQQFNQYSRVKKQKQIKIKAIINKFTQQGYDLTKYSKDGFNPHQKRFFLSQDLKKLFWQQQGGKNKKYIDLKSIKEIQSQKIGQGIRKHIKRPKKQQHCIISYIKDNKVKVIQLGANEKVMSIFVEEFKTLLEHLKILKENQ